MALPSKAWLTIAELAKKWRISDDILENYLLTDKLRPSIFLPEMSLLKLKFETDGRDEWPTGIGHEKSSGLYTIDGYMNLKWHKAKESGLCDLKSRNVYLEKNGDFFTFLSKYEITKKDLVVSLNEFLRFETEFLVNSDVLSDTFHPYLDHTNCNFSPELETAVAAWIALYSEGIFKSKLSHKQQIRNWINANRKKKYNLSNEAVSRIVTVVNPNKKGGLPKVATEGE